MRFKSLFAVGLAIAAWSSTADATVINAGFETGLNGWTVGGNAADASAIGSLGPIGAQAGSLMGYISTGPGGVTTTTLSQSFAATAAPVTFLVNFLTDEFTPTIFNDTLRVSNQSGTLLTLNTHNAFFGAAGTGFKEQTGFMSVILPTGSTSVTFTIFDVGDTVVHSAALIDTAQLQLNPGTPGSQPIPEPGALALFGLGLAGLGFARRRKAA